MKNVKQNNTRKNTVYGIIGLVALFLTGAIFGFIINGSDRINHSSMTKKQCENLATNIMVSVNNGGSADRLAQLNKMFSENCNNRRFLADKVQPQPVKAKNKLPETTCGAIEELLKQELYEEDSMNTYNHYDNARIYEKLSKRGCENNRENYKKLALREREIADALNEENDFVIAEADTEKKSTCEEIEDLLNANLNKYRDMGDAQDRVKRAQIYANLSERGCVENSDKYKELAKQELEIARALIDDDIDHNEREATEMVETYKRLRMQAEATKMIEKAKKLTNPAIDFIIQLERIIEE